MQVIVYCLLGFIAAFSLVRSCIRCVFQNKEVAVSEWKRGIYILTAGALVLFAGEFGSRVWITSLWFEEVHYAQRYWTVLWAMCKYFLYAFVLAEIFFLSNLYLLQRKKVEDVPYVFLVIHVACVFISIIIGIMTAQQYEHFLLYGNQVPFGVVDPIFGKDVGFYVFSVPIFAYITKIAMVVILTAICIVFFVYWRQFSRAAFHGYDKAMGERSVEKKRHIVFNSLTHISILGVCAMIAVIACTLVAKWDLLFSTRGAVFGAGWTDINVQLPAYWALIVTAAACALFFAISAVTHSQRLTKIGVLVGTSVFVVVWLCGVEIFPAIMQKAYVSSNEIVKETEYIKHNIAFTRMAYGLTDDRVQHVDFPVAQNISKDLIAKNQATLDSVRLWDFRVLHSLYSQTQIMRTYYTFPDVDVVRYNVDGKPMQLMCSVREIDHDRLPEQSKTWQNKHLFYTHGFGMVANPVDTFLPGGIPDLWIKDIPPVAKTPALQIDQPRVYFGEVTTDHVYVNAKQAEFDYPQNENNITTHYDGPGGILVGTGLRKFAFAWTFDGFRLLTSNEIVPETRIMFDRDITSRVQKIAPFLRYDKDPYHVIADKQIWYIWDAYTVSDRFPYSEMEGKINYIRNSVKVVMNAYTGIVDLYVFDDKDPIIKTYEKIFPTMFKSASAMPASLRQHVRYPEDLLSVQGDVYARYHMGDPTVFYNNEDKWEVAKELSGNNAVSNVLPYYVTMRIPGETKEEFALILPFTPYSNDPVKHPRNNMVSWLAGRCDGEHYGKLLAYSFPKDRFINGPLQIGIRINQDETIKNQIALWNSKGSKVIFANLIVLPLADYQLLYVQPIYLEAEQGKMSELKRVVVAIGDHLAFGVSFEDALRKLLGENNSSQSASVSAAEHIGGVRTSDDLIKEAAKYYESYRELSGQGKYGEAGQAMEELGKILNELKSVK